MKKSPIKDLVKVLKEDEGYYQSWKDNIAMAFYDEYQLRDYFNDINISELSNNAAERFLKQLIDE